MKSFDVLLALCAVPVALTMSCEPLSEGSTDCDSTAECALESVCILPERQCVPEQMDTVIGSFSCLLLGTGESTPEFGSTDVIASVQGGRWPLTSFAKCNLSEKGNVIISLWLMESEEAATFLILVLPPEFVFSGQTGLLQPGAGALIQDPGEVTLGYAEETTVTVSPTQVGERLHGYVRGRLISAQ